MKTFFINFLLLFSVPYYIKAQKAPKVIFPKSTFDVVQAKRMISSDGKATLRGTVSRNSNYKVNVVELYPCTDYFYEWYELKKKDKKGKKHIYMSNEAYSYRILTKIQADGSFEFKGLNPGKYYINTLVYETKSGIGERQVGTETVTTKNGYGHLLSSYDRPIMEKYRFLYETVDRLESFTEISSEEQTVNVTL
ncbi:hypothetical protein BWD42_17190 [Sphingobacterium sp. CZ-UAM]|uniref:hypothetical protein n=1 Tax=Sphingobacterium sp. CZ-UAM TaxID=1933868 RepID=UPI0009860760|nr:hypothetical protein [Sphingobacterium sp. CZ-UAM]OOG17188.1 hypothetical protein BWD42_17190 [Sphingobacterium sp. CZ-UAM]